MSGGRVVVIAGATASGKSALALAVARSLQPHVAEIVCGDSRQVYAGMAIASAQPTAAERAAVPHHGYGALDPATEAMTAQRFVDDTDAAVSAILARGHTAVVVGGTGLYLRAWRQGLDAPAGDAALRAQLNEELLRDGLPALVARLRAVDEDAAHSTDLHNSARVVRALEVALLGGSARSTAMLLARPPRVQATWLLVAAEAGWLSPRVVARVASMFGAGLVDEALALRRLVGPTHELLRTMGTEEALAVADGTMTTTAAHEQVAARTRQYARRQRTWFKKEPWWQPLNAASGSLVDDALALLPPAR